MIAYVASAWKSLLAAPPEIQAVLLTALLGSVYRIFQPKAKLIWGRANNSFNNINVEDEKIAIYCAKYYIQNVGRVALRDVEICFSVPPRDFSIFPQLNFKNEMTGKGSMIVRLGHLSPAELVIVDAIDIDTLHEVASVRSPQCEGKMVKFEVVRDLPVLKWVLVGMVLLGTIFLIQVAIAAIRALQ